MSGVPTNNCIPFERPSASAQGGRPGRAMRSAAAESLADIFDHMSPAQCAFLSGVFAILAAHGEEALTRSCEMVLERFGRGHAG